MSNRYLSVAFVGGGFFSILILLILMLNVPSTLICSPDNLMNVLQMSQYKLLDIKPLKLNKQQLCAILQGNNAFSKGICVIVNLRQTNFPYLIALGQRSMSLFAQSGRQNVVLSVAGLRTGTITKLFCVTGFPSALILIFSF